MPPLQSPEQQSALVVQALPSVLHIELSAAHLPPVHEPLQHWLFAVHATPSEMQVGKPHAPLLQTLLQQLAFALHVAPSIEHPPSPPNGLPASPTPITGPLLLPPLPPPLLLLDVASPASSPPLPPAWLLLPQARNELPLASAVSDAIQRMSAVRRKVMAAPR